MATIKVDGETMRAKAAEIANLRDQHDSTIASIGAIIADLGGIFEGQAATSYTARFESMKPTFTSFSEMLQKFSTDLQRAAADFDNTDSTLSGSIGG